LFEKNKQKPTSTEEAENTNGENSRPTEEKVERAFDHPKCGQSPTGEHDIFHNKGTDEKYCRYCGIPG